MMLGLLAKVGVVFARSTTVIRHLIVFAVNPYGETDARNDCADSRRNARRKHVTWPSAAMRQM